MPRFSIVTVCLNTAGDIARTVESVLSQDGADYEYIVIDGGSTDGTLEILQSYGKRISVLVSEPDSGIFNAMNKAIRLSIGEYIYFLNSGDVFASNDILKKMNDLTGSSDLIYWDFLVEITPNLIIRKNVPSKLTKAYFMIDSIPHQATFIKRELFNRTGLYREDLKFTSDYEHSLRIFLSPNYSLLHIPLAVSVYNLRGVTASKNNKRVFKEERSILQKQYFGPGEYKKLRILSPFLSLFLKIIPVAIGIIKEMITRKNSKFNIAANRPGNYQIDS